MDSFERILKKIMSIAVAVGFACTILMMLIVVVNIVTRPMGHAILGTYEAVQILVTVLVSFAIGYTALQKGHVNMDMVIMRLPKSVQRILEIFGCILGLVLWGLIAWYGWQFAGEEAAISESTTIAGYPVYPFRYIFAVGAFITCLILILNIIQTIREGRANA